MLKETIRFERKNATMLTVDIHYNLKAYALAWLKLCNNAREYPNMIYKLHNNRHDDTVQVVCNPKHKENIKKYCNNLLSYWDNDKERYISVGKVINECAVVIGVPYYEFDSDADVFDDGWNYDMDSAIDIWAEVR